jgi:prolycopene isomerase
VNDTLTLKPKNTSAAPLDVIVIGSGIGGLTAAALLAKAGKSVLVLEQHDRPGGYAHSFKRKRHVFDAGVHLTSGCGLNGYQGGQIIRRVLQACDVYAQVEFIPVNPFSHAEYPNLSADLPLSINAFVTAMAAQFPDQANGLQALLALCLKISEQAAIADEIMASKNTALIQSQLSLLLKYRQSTLADVWGDFIQNVHLQSIFATHWPYLGLPPSKLSFVYWATMLIGYLVDGAYYCKGGFQKLAEALVDGLVKAGGKSRYRCAVKKIIVTDNQVQSVLLTSGEHINARCVISNADIRQTVHQMIGNEYFPKKYVARLNRMQESVSVFVTYIATNLDLIACGAHHEAFYYASLDHEANYQDALAGNITWLSITVPTLVDRSLAPAGNHIVILTTLVAYDSEQDWSQAKPTIVAKLLDLANQKIPGLKDHVLLLEAGSPATLERYTSNYKGAAYGWASTPEQSGPNRLAQRSPIDGLYFAGHWAAPGGGIYGVSFSGMQVAQQILGSPSQQQFWQQFEGVTA